MASSCGGKGRAALWGPVLYNLICKGPIYELILFQQSHVLMPSIMLVTRFPQMTLVDTNVQTIEWDGDEVWKTDVVYRVN